MDEIAVDERLAYAATLPSHCYKDAGFLARERERVFGRTWQLVGREEQVAAAGGYFTAEVAGEPVVVVRGQDGILRALSNVCRHRAGPVAAGEGTCRAFRCGYHGWSYSLDGAILATPEFAGVEDFRREEHPLPAFRVETWLGLVFVNIDPSPLSPPSQATLAGSLDDLPAALAGAGLNDMRLAHSKSWTVGCNWKTYVDNYLEGYHIPIVHPGLMQELDYARYVTETRALYSQQHSPIKKSAANRLRGSADGEEARYYWIYPNLMLNVYPDNFSTNLILPDGPEQTVMHFDWYFRDPERPEVAEAVRRTVEFSDEIQLEDIGICETVQKGLHSRTYERGRFSVRRENGVHHFHRLIARDVGEV
jgi:choline monooxygenase